MKFHFRLYSFEVMIRSLIVSVSEDRQIESIIGVQWDPMVHQSSWKRGSAEFPTFPTGTMDPRGGCLPVSCVPMPLPEHKNDKCAFFKLGSAQRCPHSAVQDRKYVIFVGKE